jgi:hypothetical protein
MFYQFHAVFKEYRNQITFYPNFLELNYYARLVHSLVILNPYFLILNHYIDLYLGFFRLYFQ